MNLEDLAKKTISEVNTQIEEQKRQKELLDEQKREEEFEPLQIIDEEELENKQKNLESKKPKKQDLEVKENEILQKQIEKEISLTKLGEENVEKKSQKIVVEELSDNAAIEDIFLKKLKERILVLFEGLNSTKKDELQARLELTINFLEFLLANIEDKLKK